MKNILKNDAIIKMIPLYSVENDFLISKNGDVSLAFKITLPKVFSLNTVNIDKINELFDTIIRTLPDGTIIQKQDYFYVDTIKNSKSKENHKQALHGNLFFYEKPLLHQESYLFITIDSKNRMSFTSTQKCYDLYNKELKAFLDKVDNSLSLLEKSGFFSVKKISDDEIIQLIGRYLSLSREENNIVKDLHFDKALRIGNNLGEIYTITTSDQLSYMFNSLDENKENSFPHARFKVPFIQPLCLGLECNHIYNQVIYMNKQDDILTKLNKLKKSPIQSNKNDLTVNSSIDDFLCVVEEKQLRLVDLHLSVILWDEEEDTLYRYKNKLENSCKELGVIPYQIKHGIKDIFLYNVPGATGSIPEDYRFLSISEQAPIFLNFESYNKGNKEGILLNDRSMETPIRLDLWDSPIKRGLIKNRNRLVFGSKEKGEAFLINHIVGQYHEQGHQIMMIDVSDSYQKINDASEGQYYSYDLDMPLQFNPFYANNLDEVTEEKIEFLSTLIQLIWKGDGAAIKTLEKQAIKEYVVRFYDDVFFNENVTLNIASFYEFVNRNKNKKSDDHYFNKESLLASLENFIGGKYKEVFNSSESINLIKKPLVVFNLGSIKDDAVLFPIVTMLCIDAFMDKIKEMPKVKKTIFINECWESISNKNLPDGIETLYIAVNKLNIELIIMTKDLQHVLDNSMGKTIIDNTDTLIMLNPKKSRDIKSKLATHLSLTESDLEKLYSINEREVFIKVGNLSNIYVIEEILCRLPRFRTPINLANNYY